MKNRNRSRYREIASPKKWGKWLRFWENAGKLLLDGAKLTFTSLVLGTVIRGGIEQLVLLQAGIIASAVAAVVGLVLITVFQEK
jgi:hypothetical protein